ncbi:MAG TPA: OmpA family protein [Thermoanaerobaculia bacterium]|nr:OmpA family protein [Thermoanaerobaculia bacterium]
MKIGKRQIPWIGLALAVALVASGCATKKYVQGQVGSSSAQMNQKMTDIEGQVENNQQTLKQHDQKIQATSKTAQEALDRAIKAGKLAQGKLLYETVLTDNDVHFGLESSKLSDTAKQALDKFADNLKQQNKNVYIEIQGHTDATGSAAYNMKLGQERAEAVRRYLNSVGIPLHRMSVISYGETAPIASNKTREGRSQNRRVTLVVLE